MARGARAERGRDNEIERRLSRFVHPPAMSAGAGCRGGGPPPNGGGTMRRFAWLVAASIAVTALVAGAGAADSGNSGHKNGGSVDHVLLVSVDGLHQSDLSWYVSHHPASALADLLRGGVDFTNAQTPFPSDSFPGMVGMVTGGNPRSTGVYYDDSWNRSLLPAGTTDCAHATAGTEVTYFEQLDRDPSRLDAGQGLSGLPDSILQMT